MRGDSKEVTGQSRCYLRAFEAQPLENKGAQTEESYVVQGTTGCRKNEGKWAIIRGKVCEWNMVTN